MLIPTPLYIQVSDRLGMTDEEILEMGSDKWFDAFIAKKGDTTVSMSEAYSIYADILEARNLKLLTSGVHDMLVRNRLLHWQRAVSKYGLQTFVIEARGGGTIWIPVASAQRVDIEEYFEKVINLEVKGNKDTKVNLDELSQTVIAQHEEITKRLSGYPKYQSVGVGRAEVLNANALARDLLIGFLPEIMKVGGAEAELTLQTMKDLSDPKTLFDPQTLTLPLSPGYEIALRF